MPNKPKPPEGYSLQDVPDFLKPIARTMRVEVENPNGVDVAKVTSAEPNVVQVNQPDQFGQPQLNHEVTHGFQFSRNPAVVQQMESDLAAGKLPKTYTYGGLGGLLRAQQEHKTIADFGPEQQAEMVRNFQQETQKAIQSGNAKELDRINQAYPRFIRQLANLPGRNESMTTMTQKDLTPPPPGLPPATISGILAPDPLLGGPMRVIPPSGYTLTK